MSTGFSFSTPQAGGFSFGTPAPQAASAGGFNFGTPSPATAPSSSATVVHPSSLTGGFSFGGGGQTQQTQTQAQNPPTNNNATGAQNPPASTGFSFGAQNPPATNATTSTGFSFGGGGGGGGQTQNPPATSATAAAANPAATTTTGFSFGQPATANPTTATAASTATTTGAQPVAITKSTKFQDLPEQYREQIIKIEKMIKKERQGSESIIQNSHQATKDVKLKVEKIQQRIVSIKISLEKDTINIGTLRQEVFRALKNAELSGRIFERLKNPNSTTLLQGSYQVSTAEYFSDLVSSFEAKIHTYKQVIGELDRILSSLMDNSTPHPQVVVEIIRSQHESFLSIAGHVASLHHGVKELKESYLEYRLKYFGDSRNPFQPPEKKKKVNPAPISAAPAQPQQPQPQQSMFGTTPFGTTGGGFGFGGGFGATPAATTTTPASTLGTTFGASTTPGFGAAATPGFGATTAAPAFGTGTTPAFGTITPAPSTFGSSATSTPFSIAPNNITLGAAPQSHGQAGLLFGSQTLTSSESKKKKKN